MRVKRGREGSKSESEQSRADQSRADQSRGKQRGLDLYDASVLFTFSTKYF